LEYFLDFGLVGKVLSFGLFKVFGSEFGLGVVLNFLESGFVLEDDVVVFLDGFLEVGLLGFEFLYQGLGSFCLIYCFLKLTDFEVDFFFFVAQLNLLVLEFDLFLLDRSERSFFRVKFMA
jgi:hypothetical protein